MDLGTLIAALCGLGAAVGSFWGTRSGKLQGLASVSQLQEAQIAILKDEIKAKDSVIAEFKNQVKILTDLVTQKADVEGVKRLCLQIKKTVEGIAGQANAQT